MTTDCYCRLARRAARVLTMQYDTALVPAQLSSAQFELLRTLQQTGAINGRALAARMLVDTTTLSRNLKLLQHDKLLLAQASAKDGRCIEYKLSTTGQQRLQQAMPLWRKAHRATEKRLGNKALSILQSITALGDLSAP